MADTSGIPLPPGGAMEIVFTFDTTGSMGAALTEVRQHLQDTVTRLFADIPALRIAIGAHGDYCGFYCGNYITKYVDFTNDVTELCNFAKTTSGSCGCDAPECYELVLKEVAEDLSWNKGTNRVLVMIGDDEPHVKNFKHKDKKQAIIDWREETKKLHKMGVKIYGVQCNNNKRAEYFYRDIASATGGRHLKLAEFNTIVDMMMAICYREKGAEFFEAYATEVKNRDGAGMRVDMENMFGSLRDDVMADESDDSGVESSPAPVLAKSRTTGGAAKKAKRPKMLKPKAPKRKMAAKVKAATASPASAAVRRRRGSGGSTSSSATAGVRRSTGMVTRRQRHQMTLRPRSTTLPTTATMTTTRTVKRLSTQKKTPRESIANSKFLLGLKWSPWKLAVIPSKIPRNGNEDWEENRGGVKGFRNVNLFHHDTKSPAVYEVGVETPSGGKYPVHYKVTNGFKRGNLETYVFGRQPRLQTQVDRVLKRGCKLHVRRALWKEGVEHDKKSVSNLDELKSLIAHTYDYAWRDHYDTHTRRYLHRNVTRDSVVIADNDNKKWKLHQ